MANKTYLAGTFLVALLLRLVYLADVSDSPYRSGLILDAESYDYLAEKIAQGNWRLDEKRTYVHGLVYPTIWAALKIAEFNHTDIRCWQAVVGALTCVLVYGIANRLSAHPVPLISGLLAAGYWPLLFFGGELFATTLFIFILLLLVYQMLRFTERPSPSAAIWTGVLLGLLVATRANALLAVPVAAWWIHRKKHTDEPPATSAARSRVWLSFATAMMLTLSPFALRNYLVQGSPVPFQGSWSFYMGTNPNADGTPYVREGLQWQRHEMLPLRAGFTEPDTKGSFYLQAGLWYIVEHPVKYAELLYRKFRLFWHAFEIPVSSDIAHFRQQSVLQKILFVGFGLVAPLALAGLLCGGRRDAPYLLLWVFVLVFLATGIIFTVSARYRVPATPFLIIAAAHALWYFVEVARTGDRRRIATFLATLITAAVIVHTGVNTKQVDHVRSDLLLGFIHSRNGEHERAQEVYSQGLAKNPDDADLLNALGTSYGARAQYSDAERAFSNAIAVADDYAQPRFNLGSLYLTLGRHEEAIAAVEKALSIDLRQLPQYQGNLTLGNLYLEIGQYGKAALAFERALSHRRNAHAYYGLSNAKAKLFDKGAQIQALEHAARVDSTFAPALRNLGVLYLGQGDLVAGEKALLQSLRHDSTSAVAYQNLAALYARSGRHNHARAALARSERLSHSEMFKTDSNGGD